MFRSKLCLAVYLKSGYRLNPHPLRYFRLEIFLANLVLELLLENAMSKLRLWPVELPVLGGLDERVVKVGPSIVGLHFCSLSLSEDSPVHNPPNRPVHLRKSLVAVKFGLALRFFKHVVRLINIG
jgi:hypothetical protein